MHVNTDDKYIIERKFTSYTPEITLQTPINILAANIRIL